MAGSVQAGVCSSDNTRVQSERCQENVSRTATVVDGLKPVDQPETVNQPELAGRSGDWAADPLPVNPSRSLTKDRSTQSSTGLVNAITFDIEDWIQSAFDPERPLTDRFVRSTHKILDLLDRHDISGTFFVLGLAAVKAPQLVREIHQRGHEVQSHGFGHRPIHTQTPKAFRDDLLRSKDLLEALIGEPVVGYRAPAFSITERTQWALDILVELGFEYDSSIFPLRTRRYGIAGLPRKPYGLQVPSGGSLIEVPVASYRFAGKLWPVGGGGYARLLPFGLFKRGVEQLNRDGSPATVYFHPYEFDPSELSELDITIPWRRRLHQGLGRGRITSKVEHLLESCRFGTIRQMLGSDKLELVGRQCPPDVSLPSSTVSI